MPLYQRGSKGAEVERIQARLKELGHYRGPLDSDFGGGTEAAVKLFQRAQGLTADGKVGAKTWQRLFGEQTPPAPAITARPLLYRCLALTGAFETSSPVPDCFAALSGDFDGQGISFGALQWCLGQGSLQPLLLEMDRSHPELLQDIFDNRCAELRAVLREERNEQLEWARQIQDRRKFGLYEPWRGMFKTLGRQEAFQQIEMKAAETLFQAALTLCKEYGVRSERAAALLFDIKTQNGSIKPVTKTRIERDFAKIDPSLDANSKEVARLRIIANRRSEAANPRWVEDVRRRKLTIANGEGTVHGSRYDLDDQYGIRLTPFATG